MEPTKHNAKSFDIIWDKLILIIYPCYLMTEEEDLAINKYLHLHPLPREARNECRNKD